MKNQVMRLIAASMLAVIVGACSAGSAGSPGPTATGSTAPAASTAATSDPGPAGGQILIKTPPAPPMACMEALASGTLAVNNQSGLGINTADGETMAVEWPFGYSARMEAGRIVLVDESGKVVARVGDEITSGGGFGNQFWHACGPVAVTKAAN